MKELKTAHDFAVYQYNKSVRDGRKEKFDQPPTMAEMKVGAAGEAAMCKLLGIPYAPKIDTFSKYHDVGRFDIRSTDKERYSLIVRPQDPDERMAVLVVVVGLKATVRGWEYTHVAKTKRHCWKNPKDYGWAWFLRQDGKDLRNVRELAEFGGKI